MKAKVKGITRVPIRGEFIRLDNMLKFTGAAETGGQAKLMIADGEVYVDGERCVQRGKKVYPGSLVRYGGRIWAASKAAGAR